MAEWDGGVGWWNGITRDYGHGWVYDRARWKGLD
jgi:hypothetical protein